MFHQDAVVRDQKDGYFSNDLLNGLATTAHLSVFS